MGFELEYVNPRTEEFILLKDGSIANLLIADVYGERFFNFLGKEGLHLMQKKKGAEVLPALRRAKKKTEIGGVLEEYTPEERTKKILDKLIEISEYAPEGEWRIY